MILIAERLQDNSKSGRLAMIVVLLAFTVLPLAGILRMTAKPVNGSQPSRDKRVIALEPQEQRLHKC